MSHFYAIYLPKVESRIQSFVFKIPFIFICFGNKMKISSAVIITDQQNSESNICRATD